MRTHLDYLPSLPAALAALTVASFVAGCGGATLGPDAAAPVDLATSASVDQSITPDLATSDAGPPDAATARKAEEFAGIYAVTRSVLVSNNCPKLGDNPFELAPPAGRSLRLTVADATTVSVIVCTNPEATSCMMVTPKEALWKLSVDRIVNESAGNLFPDPMSAPPDCVGAMLISKQFVLGGASGKDLIGTYTLGLDTVGPGCAALEDFVKKNQPGFMGMVDNCAIIYDVYAARQP